ncbi:MAG TPA: hypothetical protein VHO01_08740 [Jatrophihabitans sp.]|nr:hypothetical protein [Jatrophihabitans sp.]
MAARTSTLLIPVLAAVLLAGCTQAKKDNAAPPPTSTVASTSSTPTPSVKASPSVTASPTLGGQCDDLLPVSTVDEALGRPVIGSTAFIRGIAEPNIGRLTYLNCKYGIPKAVKGRPAPVAQLEIGVSLYKSLAQAQTRVQGTVDDYRSHGAAPQQLPVGEAQATLLTGYGLPTLVVADGPRTVAISISPALIRTAAQASLQTLARTVLVATSHFDGVPGVTATPSPSGTDSGSDSATGSASPSATSS